jgi:hypothetical protein
MKKFVALAVILCVIGSTSLYAEEDNTVWIVLGVVGGALVLTIIGGLVVWAVTDDADAGVQAMNDIWYGTSADSSIREVDSRDMRESGVAKPTVPAFVNNPLVQHLSIGSAEEKVFVGASFRW